MVSTVVHCYIDCMYVYMYVDIISFSISLPALPLAQTADCFFNRKIVGKFFPSAKKKMGQNDFCHLHAAAGFLLAALLLFNYDADDDV